jgi:glutathione peroxidase
MPTSLHDFTQKTIDGAEQSLSDYKGKVLLVVNVASRCGLTPHYAGMQSLHDEFKARGFSVLGFPCNQFLEQEPGSAEEIRTFCSTSYGVTFPLYEKIDVNGDDRHPLYEVLTATADSEGHSGDIRWNFEKFLVGPDGEVVARYNPTVEPEAPQIVDAIEAALAK